MLFWKMLFFPRLNTESVWKLSYGEHKHSINLKIHQLEWPLQIFKQEKNPWNNRELLLDDREFYFIWGFTKKWNISKVLNVNSEICQSDMTFSKVFFQIILYSIFSNILHFHQRVNMSSRLSWFLLFFFLIITPKSS